MSGGRWTFCPHCGSTGYVDWGYELHGAIGTCPNAASWRGMGEEVTDRAAEECDRLNELEDVSPAFAAALAPRPSDAKMERLRTALDAYNRADLAYDDGSVEAAHVCIRAQNVLLDTCVECGMATDGDEFAFAARMVTRWLVEA